MTTRQQRISGLIGCQGFIFRHYLRFLTLFLTLFQHHFPLFMEFFFCSFFLLAILSSQSQSKSEVWGSVIDQSIYLAVNMFWWKESPRFRVSGFWTINELGKQFSFSEPFFSHMFFSKSLPLPQVWQKTQYDDYMKCIV